MATVSATAYERLVRSQMEYGWLYREADVFGVKVYLDDDDL